MYLSMYEKQVKTKTNGSIVFGNWWNVITLAGTSGPIKKWMTGVALLLSYDLPIMIL